MCVYICFERVEKESNVTFELNARGRRNCVPVWGGGGSSGGVEFRSSDGVRDRMHDIRG
jgi:hypothetical protein